MFSILRFRRTEFLSNLNEESFVRVCIEFLGKMVKFFECYRPAKETSQTLLGLLTAAVLHRVARRIQEPDSIVLSRTFPEEPNASPSPTHTHS